MDAENDQSGSPMATASSSAATATATTTAIQGGMVAPPGVAPVDGALTLATSHIDGDLNHSQGSSGAIVDPAGQASMLQSKPLYAYADEEAANEWLLRRMGGAPLGDADSGMGARATDTTSMPIEWF